MTQFGNLDAVEMAALVRSGQVRAADLVDAACAAVERLNPAVNAVVTFMADRAREEAAGPLADGPLMGVPVLLKDAVAEYRGSRLTYGSRLLGEYVSSRDSEYVRRLRRAGAIVIGKANTPEFAIMGTTEPLRFGPTRNPWNLELSVGGSSGGSAAAVAAGMVPVAHGTDSGGSIRIPAAWCGLVGLKPTRGRNPLGPRYGDVASGLLCEHVLTRSVRDSAAVLDATSGPAVGDPYWAPERRMPFSDELAQPPRRLRIAWSTAASWGIDIDPACSSAVQAVAALCQDLGHIVVEKSLPASAESVGDAFRVVASAGVAWEIDHCARIAGTTPSPDSLEPYSWRVYQRGRRQTAAEYLHAVEMLQVTARSVGEAFQDLDIYLTPTLATTALPLGSWRIADGDMSRISQLELATSAFTILFNATGQPAMSLPTNRAPGGLPVGVHIAGRFGDEATLLRLAAQLEEATAWIARRPLVHCSNPGVVGGASEPGEAS